MGNLKTVIISLAAFLLVVGAVSAVSMSVDELREILNKNETDYQTEEVMFEDEQLGGMHGGISDVVGTRTASTTVSVGFYGANTASTTYSEYIGYDTDLAIYDIYFEAASSSANAIFSILASPDPFCATASTTGGTMNPYLVNDVQWFDAGDHLSNKVHSTSLAIGTSTISIINPVAGTGRRIILDNLASQCLALQVNASSTKIQAQLTLKQK